MNTAQTSWYSSNLSLLHFLTFFFGCFLFRIQRSFTCFSQAFRCIVYNRMAACASWIWQNTRDDFSLFVAVFAIAGLSKIKNPGKRTGSGEVGNFDNFQQLLILTESCSPCWTATESNFSDNFLREGVPPLTTARNGLYLDVSRMCFRGWSRNNTW